MISQIGAMGRALLTPLLTDRATLEEPDRTESDGWKTPVTGVACYLVDATGQLQSVPGGMAVVTEDRLYLLPTQTIGAKWRATITTRGNRRMIVENVVAPPAAPLQYVTAGGARNGG
jgi:hypothetical protein